MGGEFTYQQIMTGLHLPEQNVRYGARRRRPKFRDGSDTDELMEEVKAEAIRRYAEKHGYGPANICTAEGDGDVCVAMAYRDDPNPSL